MDNKSERSQIVRSFPNGRLQVSTFPVGLLPQPPHFRLFSFFLFFLFSSYE